MALTFASIDRFADNISRSAYPTASVTLALGKGYIIGVSSTLGSAPTTPTIAGWRQVATVGYHTTGSPNRRITVFARSGNGSTGSQTIDFGGVAQTSCIYSLVEIAGHDTYGTDLDGAIAQAITGAANTVTSLLITLGIVAPGNATLGFFAHSANETTPVGAGYTALDDQHIASPTTAFLSEYQVAVDNTVDTGVWATAANCGGIALHIRADAGPYVATISPTWGAVGSSVTIRGSNFWGAVAVHFGNVSASFTVISPTQISATVPVGATTGAVSVTTPSGTAYSDHVIQTAWFCDMRDANGIYTGVAGGNFVTGSDGAEVLIGRPIGIQRRYLKVGFEHPDTVETGTWASQGTGAVYSAGHRIPYSVHQCTDPTPFGWWDIANNTGTYDFGNGFGAETIQSYVRRQARNYIANAKPFWFCFNHEPENDSAAVGTLTGNANNKGDIASGANNFKAAYDKWITWWAAEGLVEGGPILKAYLVVLMKTTFDGSNGGAAAWMPTQGFTAVGVDMYNKQANPWDTFASLGSAARSFAASIGKKFVIGEVGCWEGPDGANAANTKDQWFADARAELRKAAWSDCILIDWTDRAADAHYEIDTIPSGTPGSPWHETDGLHGTSAALAAFKLLIQDAFYADTTRGYTGSGFGTFTVTVAASFQRASGGVLPRIFWTVGGQPIALADWTANSTADLGCDQMRGTLALTDYARFGGTLAVGQVVKGWTEYGFPMWEGRLSVPPKMFADGRAEFAAQGNGAAAAKMTSRLFFQGRGPQLFQDATQPPYNRRSDATGITIGYGINNVSGATYVDPRVLQFTLTAAGGTHYEAELWVPGSKITRIKVEEVWPGNINNSILLQVADSADGSVRTEWKGSGIGLFAPDVTLSAPGEALVVRLEAITPPLGASATLTGITVWGETTLDRAYAEDVCRAIGAKLGWDTTHITGSGGVSVLPVDWASDWASLLSYASSFDDLCWGAYEDEGSGPKLLMDRYDAQVWTVAGATGARWDLDPLEPYSSVAVGYLTPTVTAAQVSWQVPQGTWILSGDVIQATSNQARAVLSDRQPTNDLAVLTGQRILEALGAQRYRGQVQFSSALDPSGRDACYEVRPGSTLLIADAAQGESIRLRVHDVAYSPSGVTVGCEMPAIVSGLDFGGGNIGGTGSTGSSAPPVGGGVATPGQAQLPPGAPGSGTGPGSGVGGGGPFPRGMPPPDWGHGLPGR